VLVRTGGAVFIFSAAHALAKFKNAFIWLGSDGLPELVPLVGGQFQFTGLSGIDDHQQDPLDAAVYLLPPHSPSDLIAQAFEISAHEPISDQPDPRYLLLGQPANRTDIDNRREEIVSENEATIWMEVEDSIYIKSEYYKQTHLVLDWRSEWRTGTSTHAARNLEGSSGGAIWRFSLRKPATAELVGTFTEFTPPKKGRRFLVGTRILVHLALVRDLMAQTAS
jgi:hypothetical protein